MSDTETPTRQDAFHQLGTEIPVGMSLAEGLEYAHMAGWNVRTEPLALLLRDGDPDLRVAPDLNAVLRTSPFDGGTDMLGVVGSRWTPFQNEDVAGLLGDLTDMSGARLTTALVLKGGRKTGFVLTLPEPMTFTSPRTGETDLTDLNLVVFNNHDGFGSLSWNITPIRPSCANQQRMVEASTLTRGSLRHTGDQAARFADLRQVVAAAAGYRDEFEREVRELIGREMDDYLVRAELEHIFQAGWRPGVTERQLKARKKQAVEVFGVYQSSATVAPFSGTAYGVYNAVTEYTDHFMPVRGGDGVALDERRALRTLESGQVDVLKQRAFATLLG